MSLSELLAADSPRVKAISEYLIRARSRSRWAPYARYRSSRYTAAGRP